MIDIYSYIQPFIKNNDCVDLKIDAICDHSKQKIQLNIENCEPCCLTIEAKNSKGHIVWYKYNLDVTAEHEYIPFTNPKIRKKNFDFRTRKCCA